MRGLLGPVHPSQNKKLLKTEREEILRPKALRSRQVQNAAREKPNLTKRHTHRQAQTQLQPVSLARFSAHSIRGLSMRWLSRYHGNFPT